MDVHFWPRHGWVYAQTHTQGCTCLLLCFWASWEIPNLLKVKIGLRSNQTIRKEPWKTYFMTPVTLLSFCYRSTCWPPNWSLACGKCHICQPSGTLFPPLGIWSSLTAVAQALLRRQGPAVERNTNACRSE